MLVRREMLSVGKVYSICLRLGGELLIMDATCDLEMKPVLRLHLEMQGWKNEDEREKKKTALPSGTQF